MRTLLIIILTVLSTLIFAQKNERNLLTSRRSFESLENLLVEPYQWVLSKGCQRMAENSS